jgi:hypothetical protein
MINRGLMQHVFTADDIMKRYKISNCKLILPRIKTDEMHIYQHRPESACRCMFVPVCLCSTASVPLPEHMTEVCKVWFSDAIIILKNDKLCKPLGLWFVVRNIFRRASKG